MFFFSVFNALFVLIVFMLTLHKDTLYINWPLGIRENITITQYDEVRFSCQVMRKNSVITNYKARPTVSPVANIVFT